MSVVKEDEVLDERSEHEAVLKANKSKPVVHGFDTAATFLLDLPFENLYEETQYSSGSGNMFRCKGCRQLFPRMQRETHWKRHRASRDAGKYTQPKEGKMATATKEKAPKVAKVTAASQGFPKEYLAENGNFRVGMDARAKSDLVCAVLGIESQDALYKFSKAEATKLIAVRGWESFVEKKKQAIANLEQRKAAAAQKKAEAAKEKAASKATSKAKPAAAATGTAKPDPKPKAPQASGRKRKLRSVQ